MRRFASRPIKLARLFLAFSFAAALILTAYFSYSTYHYTESLNHELVTKQHARLTYNIDVVKDELIGYMLMGSWDALHSRLKGLSKKGEGVFSFISHDEYKKVNTAQMHHEKDYDWVSGKGTLTVYEEILDVDGQLLGGIVGLKKIDEVDPFHLKQLFVRFAMGYLIVLCLIFLVLEVGVKKYLVSPVRDLLARLRFEKIHNWSASEMNTGRVVVIKEIADMSEEFHSLVAKLASSIVEKERVVADLNKQEGRGQVAAQVAHDIRSPLTALRVVSAHLSEVSEEKRVMIRNAVQRIDDIANDLAARKSPSVQSEVTHGHDEVASVQLLSSLIEPLISEKRSQFRVRLGVTIQSTLDAMSYGMFAKVQPVEFKRVLSNLVNNAVESLRATGTVTVSLIQHAGAIQITVTDTGTGIPCEILPQLMQRGATFGKSAGSGLGLYHARTAVESWGGTLTLASREGQGTTVTLTLPRATPPVWFVPELVLPAQSTVVVVDDDTSIHHVWEERFAGLRLHAHAITVQHFSSGTEVREWFRNNHPTLFLCDYELLGEPHNGLDLIEQLGLHQQAILVTSRYEDPHVWERCAAMGVRVIPKGLAGLVPLRVVEAQCVPADAIIAGTTPICVEPDTP